MPKIQVSAIVKCKKQPAYNLLKDIQNFPKFMSDIKKIEVIKNDKNKLLTSWDIVIDKANILWTEEDIYDDEKMNMKFRMIEGDYNSYEGVWKLEEVQKGTKIILSADFDWGVPAFEKIVGKIIERKAKKALMSMVKAMKNKLEKA